MRIEKLISKHFGSQPEYIQQLLAKKIRLAIYREIFKLLSGEQDNLSQVAPRFVKELLDKEVS